MRKRLLLRAGETTYDLVLEGEGEELRLSGSADGEPIEGLRGKVTLDPPWVVIRADGVVHRCAVAAGGSGSVWVALCGRSVRLERARPGGERAGAAAQACDEVRAPMTGTLLGVEVKAGDEVRRGDLLAVMEAMKMEYRLEAPADGAVERVECKPGEMIEVGTLLVKLRIAGTDPPDPACQDREAGP